MKVETYNGRLQPVSCYIKGCEVEMGAAWIHGMNDKNPITQIQKKLRLATFATDYDNQVVYSYATGGEYSEDKIAEAWQEHEMVGSTRW